MSEYRQAFVAILLMVLLAQLHHSPPVSHAFQYPAGHLAAFFMGAPASQDTAEVVIHTVPRVCVGSACSGMVFFAFIGGLGGAYWCGKRIRRWIILLPLCYVITLAANTARIVMAWQFRRFTGSLLSDWMQDYAHMAIGIICFLSVTATLLYAIFFKSQPAKDHP